MPRFSKRGGEVEAINLKESDKDMKKIITAGLIVLVGIVAVFIAGCVNNPANPTTVPSAIDDFSVQIMRKWSTDSLGYYVGGGDSDLSHQEEYKAGEGWKFIILDIWVFNTANESMILKYPHIVDEAGVEYYPVILEGDAHFCYYQNDEYLRKKYRFGDWRTKLRLLGHSNRHITVVYKIPINESPAKFYYQICDSYGKFLSLASKDL